MWLRKELFFVLIFNSFILTVFTSLIAIDTYNLHLMLTKLLSKPIFPVERVVK